jgi:2-C-methyl-D-erythritol 4-phosphate cytidylyltransferase
LPVIAPGEEKYFSSLIMLPFFNTVNNIFPVVGGEKRQASVYNALELLYREGVSGDTLICVHDGARPLVDEGLIQKVVEEAQMSHAAITGVAVKDTVKMVDNSDHEIVKSTIPREYLILTQTPQCFSFSILWEAHTKALVEGFEGSDDAVLVERMDVPVKVVPGSYDNIKLTTPHDLNIAEALYSITRV